jgi:hypothetical protein
VNGFTPWSIEASQWTLPYAPHVIVAKSTTASALKGDPKEGEEEEEKEDNKNGHTQKQTAAMNEGCVAGLTNQCFTSDFRVGTYFETTKLGVCDTLVTYDEVLYDGNDYGEEGKRNIAACYCLLRLAAACCCLLLLAAACCCLLLLAAAAWPTPLTPKTTHITLSTTTTTTTTTNHHYYHHQPPTTPTTNHPHHFQTTKNTRRRSTRKWTTPPFVD